MDRKYSLIDETREYYGRTLHRIQALKDFGAVKTGDLGGWVECEYNLSHDGLCWIYDDAMVMDSAVVKDSAFVVDSAKVMGSAKVMDSAIVRNSVVVSNSAIVRDSAIVMDSTFVVDSAIVMDSAVVKDSAAVMGTASICGSSIIAGNARIKSNAYVKDTIVDGKVVIGKNGYITNGDSYFAVDNIGSRHDTTTFYLDKDKTIWVTTGCFNDTLEAFKQAVTQMHKTNNYAKGYRTAILLAKSILRNRRSIYL